MATISAINGVDIGNVAKINGIDIANIASVNGGDVVTADFVATIDATYVDSELTDFPIGIKLNAGDGFAGYSATDWQYLHATVGGSECYVEVDIWDTTANIAVLWVKVPTVSASADTTVTLELIPELESATEITSTTVYDDFIGDDGSDPDASLWIKETLAGTDYLSIQSNALNYASNDSQQNITRIVATHILSGDFDIELDGLDIDTFVAASSTGSHAMMLRVTGFDGISMGSISVFRSSGTLAYYSNGTSSGNFASDVSIPLSGGKLRLTRVSGVVTAFYWDAGAAQWEWSGSTSGRTVSSSNTSDAYIEIINIVEANCELSCSADLLTINSCDSLYLFSGPDMLDDFVADDDSDPDTSLWVKETTSGTDHLFIQDNKLSYISNEAQANNTTITSLFALTGDFDIELDGLDIDTFVAASSTGSHLAYMKAVTLSGTVLGSISVFRSSGTLAYFSDGINSGNFASDVSIPLSGGKLRLTRVSGVVRGFYWDGVAGQWEWSGAVAGRTLTSGYSQDVRIVIEYDIEASADVSCTVDQFKINYCDYISQYVDQTAGWAAQQVWDSNYVGVWHMSQDPSGGTDSILDSTANANHGTPQGTMTSDDLVDEGFGKAIEFDGTNGVSVTSSESLKVSTNATVELYYKDRGTTTSYAAQLFKRQSYLWTARSASALNAISNIYLSGAWRGIANYAISQDTWLHGAFTYNSTSELLAEYINGTLNQSAVQTGLGAITQTDYSLSIGFDNLNSWYSISSHSEIRISNIDRSAAWIKATAQNLLGNLVAIS